MKSKLFHRNFSLLIAGQASSLLGNGILDFAMSMYVRESLYPVRDAGGVYRIDPACRLRVFHLCHFLYPETDARQYDGEGFLLFKFLFPVHPAFGTDLLRRSA